MRNRFNSFNSGRANFFLVGFIALVLAGAVLRITAPVVLPFIIAVLLALVMEPMVATFQKLHIPRVVSIFMVIIFIAAALYLLGIILFNSASTILTLYPRYERRFLEIYAWIADLFNLPYDEHQSVFDNLWGQLGVRSKVGEWTLSLTNSFIAFLRDAVMVLLFIVFLMLESSHLHQKVELAFENRKSGKIKSIIQDIVRDVSHYLSIKFFISLATGIIVTLTLRLVGMDFPIVWGVISFILNFIPNIGSIVAGLGVGLFSLVQFWPEPEPIFWSIFIMLGTNMVIGNFLEPKIQGDNLGLSPFVVVVSLLAWGWLWGFAGLVLAVPMTVMVKIVCENIPVLEPASIILGSYKAAVRRRQIEDAEAADAAVAPMTSDMAVSDAVDNSSDKIPTQDKRRTGLVDGDGSEI